MSYSAQVWVDYRKFEREFGTTLSIPLYVKFFRERIERGTWRKIPKGLKDAFAHPRNDDERKLVELIAEGDADEARSLEMELFKQKTRLAYAERSLQARTTEQTRERALDDQRGAHEQMEAAQARLADLRRTEPLEHDSRIHPGQYVPVMIMQDGRRTVIPMRYQCRLPGWTAFVERKHPENYNARREDLGKAWSKLFGYRHGIMVVNRFHENVPRHKLEQREPAPGEEVENVALEFNPDPPRDMLVACLWNFSLAGTPEERDIFSFATITDESPPEIAAAGHDRCIVPIKPCNVDAWLNPDPGNLRALHAILDDRDLPDYERRRAV